MLQGFVGQLLNQARGQAAKALPALPAVLRKSVGTIDDILVRPVNRAIQESRLYPYGKGGGGFPETFVRGHAADRLVRQQVGRFPPAISFPASDKAPYFTQTGAQRFLKEYGSLLKDPRAGTTNLLQRFSPSGSFPLDNPLTRLQGTQRYLTRQGSDLLQKAQAFGPTALNPLASRTPTTMLGKVGSMLNPLNPANFRNLLTGTAISAFVPEDNALKGNLEIFAYTPGNLATKAGATLLFGATDAGPRDEMALERELRAKGIMPAGGDASIRNKEGKVWAGTNYGFQSPESFNKLYDANLPTTPGGTPPPAPVLSPPPEVVDRRAGQQIPPAAPVVPGVLSNGAGVPAQRQNVQQRALSQEVLNAAQQYAAPTSVPLSSFYEGQQQLGRSLLKGGVLQQQLQDLGGAKGMTTEALNQWAQANPGLAYSLLEKMKRRVQ
jgi:hypothetical protein